jgi:hypothetical protein
MMADLFKVFIEAVKRGGENNAVPENTPVVEPDRKQENFFIYTRNENGARLRREKIKKSVKTPGKRFELLRCRAPVAFKATAFPD